MDLHSQINGNDIEWQVFIGPPNIEYPTYSPTIKHDFFTLQPNTETFITFALEHETVLPKRGLFQPKQYCSEDISMEESVSCYKKCFLDRLKINCIPKIINTFDMLSMTACNTDEEDDEILLSLLEETFPPTDCDCLDPCSQDKYSFKVNFINYNSNR